MTQLSDYLVLLVLNSLLCAGLYILTRHETVDGVYYKQPLWWIDAGSRLWFGETATKPVCACFVCMASLHSILPFWSQHAPTPTNALIYLTYVIALAGLNGIAQQHIP